MSAGSVEGRCGICGLCSSILQSRHRSESQREGEWAGLAMGPIDRARRSYSGDDEGEDDGSCSLNREDAGIFGCEAESRYWKQPDLWLRTTGSWSQVCAMLR